MLLLFSEKRDKLLFGVEGKYQRIRWCREISTKCLRLQNRSICSFTYCVVTGFTSDVCSAILRSYDKLSKDVRTLGPEGFGAFLFFQTKCGCKKVHRLIFIRICFL